VIKYENLDRIISLSKTVMVGIDLVSSEERGRVLNAKT
jgi:hypothetical protein